MSGSPTGVRIAGAVLVGVLAVAAALVFVGIYLGLPGSDHVWALLTMGIVALVFALVSYLARSFTADGAVARSAAWGFASLGFALLLLTLAINPGPVFSTGGQITALILVLLALAVMVAGVYWMGRSNIATAQRREARNDWESRPTVNALDYSTAKAPSAGTPPAVPGSGGKP